MSSSSGIREVYFNRRMAVVLALGFSSGLPLMLTQGTMQAWLVKSGVDVKQIGLFGLVTLPYSLKFFWAPLLDRYALPWLAPLGRRRGWMIVTQLALAFALAGMALASPQKSIWAFAWLALLVAFVGASQDIVIDAYRTDVLREPERGAGAAMNVNGYRLAMILTGGGMMALAAWSDFGLVYALTPAMLLVGIAATLLAPEPDAPAKPPASLLEAVRDPFVEFFTRLGGSGWLVLAFILLFKIPEVTVGWQIIPFLTKGVNFSPAEVGFAQGVLGLTLTLLGAIVGGGVVARLGLVRALWVVGLLGAISNAGFLLLSVVGSSPAVLARLDLPWLGPAIITRGQALMAAVVGAEAFCNGLVTAGFVAFMMTQCDRRYSATQYALLSSVMGLTGVLFRTPTGYIVDALGWPGFFAATILVGIPGMALIPWLKLGPDKPPQ